MGRPRPLLWYGSFQLIAGYFLLISASKYGLGNARIVCSIVRLGRVPVAWATKRYSEALRQGENAKPPILPGEGLGRLCVIKRAGAKEAKARPEMAVFNRQPAADSFKASCEVSF